MLNSKNCQSDILLGGIDMGLLSNILKGLLGSVSEKAVSTQKSDPNFRKYVSQYSGLSNDQLLEKMRSTNDPTKKAALYHLSKRNSLKEL